MSESTPYLRLADNGTFYVHWTENRIGKRVSTRQKDLAEAQKFLGQWLLMDRDAARDERKGAALTIGDLWPIYLERQIAGGPSETTVKSLTANLMTHFGPLLVAQATQQVVDAYVRKRTTGRLGRKAKPNSCRKELIQLGACLNFCSKQKFKQRLFDPGLFEPFDVPDQAEPRDRWLSQDEMKAIHKAAEAMRKHNGERRLSRLQRFIWLALETGGREMAIRELTWDRVDFDVKILDLRNPRRPLTFKKAASVPISDALLAVLKQAHAERTSKYVLDHPGKIWESVQLAVIRAGLDPKQKYPVHKVRATGVSPHVFRHTAATHMARRGVPLWIVANVLGNTIGMVERVYAKWQPEGARNAVNMISSNVEAAE